MNRSVIMKIKHFPDSALLVIGIHGLLDAAKTGVKVRCYVVRVVDFVLGNVHNMATVIGQRE